MRVGTGDGPFAMMTVTTGAPRSVASRNSAAGEMATYEIKGRLEHVTGNRYLAIAIAVSVPAATGQSMSLSAPTVSGSEGERQLAALVARIQDALKKRGDLVCGVDIFVEDSPREVPHHPTACAPAGLTKVDGIAPTVPATPPDEASRET